MRMLITGSSGEIGTNLGIKLAEENIGALGVDKRANPWTNKFEYLVKNLTEYKLDEVKGKFDVVVYLAANAKVHDSVLKPEIAFENFVLTFNALEYCRKTSAPVILASSREVYGNIRTEITEETQAEILSTESPHSASKVSSKVFVCTYSRSYGLPYIVFRFSNVYGRYDNDIERMERVIPLFINKISDNEPITIFGKDKVLDFSYVDDCIDGIVRGIAAVISGRVRNETINIAYGGGHSLETIANDWRYASRLMHPKTVLVFDDYWPGRTDAGAKVTVDDIDKSQYDVKCLFITDHFKKTDFGELTIKLILVRKSR